MAWATTHPWFWPVAIIISSFILEDPTTLTTAGLIGKGVISFELGFLSLMLGVFLGDLGLYFLGTLIRRRLWKPRYSDYIQPSILSIFMARFIPGMRTITFVSAGYVKLPVGRFILCILSTSIIWTFVILYFGQQLFQWLNAYPGWLAPLVGVVLFICLKVIERRFKRSV